MEQDFNHPPGNFAQTRCFNHARREAAARCPACGRFFCRECVSEHRNRLLCASCIAEEGVQAGVRPKQSSGVARAMVRMAVGVLVLWMAFFMMGKALLSVPSAFHDQDSLVVDASEETDAP